MAKHNISAAGRARCAEAGSANLRRYQETHKDVRAEIETAVSAFRQELTNELGGELSGVQAAGVATAVALYIGILRIQNYLLANTSRIERVAQLQQQLAVSSGTLLRVFRSLGITLNGADEDDAGAESEEALLARYAGEEKEGCG